MDERRTLEPGKGGEGSMAERLTRRLRSKRGQSILEYLVITTVVVLAILGIKGMVDTKARELFNGAGNKIGEAATLIGNFNVNAH